MTPRLLLMVTSYIDVVVLHCLLFYKMQQEKFRERYICYTVRYCPPTAYRELVKSTGDSTFSLNP